MPKNIVILLDGTSNGITSQRTNILRLYGCLRKSETQLVYYDPGVGTMGAQGTWSRRVQKASELWGMATGAGIDHNVKEAYRFLVENYSDGKAGDGERDRIYLFGFSRGAYTARILAGFIYTIGLIKCDNEGSDHRRQLAKCVDAPPVPSEHEEQPRSRPHLQQNLECVQSCLQVKG